VFYETMYKKKTYCELCGFKAEHSCQLDVDHVDGDHSNNNPDNLQTLCANCHRLKTFMNKDWETKTEEEEEF
jgi:5-methylcytosine-specific restriction endonuclease McrA